MKKIVRGLATVGMVLLLGGAAFALEGYAGKIETFERPGLTVHTYNSTEGMLDGSVVFETEKELVRWNLNRCRSRPKS